MTGLKEGCHLISNEAEFILIKRGLNYIKRRKLRLFKIGSKLHHLEEEVR